MSDELYDSALVIAASLDRVAESLAADEDCGGFSLRAPMSHYIGDVAKSLRSIAKAVTPSDTGGGKDEAGGYVTSLTEAVMGNTAGLCRIADAIHDLAEAVREK